MRLKKAVIKSANSNKTLAVVTGTLVAQYDINPVDEARSPEAVEEDVANEFESYVGATGALRPVGELDVKANDRIIEINLRVEYGPVLGACESDLRRAIPKALEGHALVDSAVFNVSRKEKTPEDVVVIVKDMEAKMDDIAVPLAARHNLSKAVARLQAQLQALQEAR